MIMKMLVKGGMKNNHIGLKVTLGKDISVQRFLQNISEKGKDGFSWTSFSKPVIAGTKESSAGSTPSIVIKCAL